MDSWSRTSAVSHSSKHASLECTDLERCTLHESVFPPVQLVCLSFRTQLTRRSSSFSVTSIGFPLSSLLVPSMPILVLLCLVFVRQPGAGLSLTACCWVHGGPSSDCPTIAYRQWEVSNLKLRALSLCCLLRLTVTVTVSDWRSLARCLFWVYVGFRCMRMCDYELSMCDHWYRLVISSLIHYSTCVLQPQVEVSQVVQKAWKAKLLKLN